MAPVELGLELLWYLESSLGNALGSATHLWIYGAGGRLIHGAPRSPLLPVGALPSWVFGCFHFSCHQEPSERKGEFAFFFFFFVMDVSLRSCM